MILPHRRHTTPVAAIAIGGGDIVQPQHSSSNIDTAGTLLTVEVTEEVTGGTSGDGGFSLSASGGLAYLTYSSSPDSRTRTYSISRTILQYETVYLAYSPGDIEDVAGNDLVTFSGTSVTNNSTQTGAITLSSAAYSGGGGLSLVFSGAANASGTPSGFSMTINGGSPPTLFYQSGSGTNTLSYTQNDAVNPGDTLLLSYSTMSGGNITGLSDFTDQAVTNNS